MTDLDLSSQLYNLIGDRSAMTNGEEWEHGPLRALVVDVVKLAARAERIEPPPPLRPPNVATPEQQKAHVAHARQTLSARKTGQVS